MANLTSALLCDYAQVREKLLFVSSGALTRAYRPEVPAQLGMMLAGIVEVGAHELAQVHSVYVVVKAVETAEVIARVDGGLQISDDPGAGPPGGAIQPGESLLAPLVLDLRPVMMPRFGQYDVHVNVDGDGPKVMSFWLMQNPGPPDP